MGRTGGGSGGGVGGGGGKVVTPRGADAARRELATSPTRRGVELRTARRRELLTTPAARRERTDAFAVVPGGELVTTPARGEVGRAGRAAVRGDAIGVGRAGHCGAGSHLVRVRVRVRAKVRVRVRIRVGNRVRARLGLGLGLGLG